MVEVFLALISGVITVLAPCILPLLPVIVGGSFDGHKNSKRPYIVAASLVFSVVIFTLLLKASTSLIGIDPAVWTTLSGGLIIILGLMMLFPSLWERLVAKFGIQVRSQKLLGKAATPGSKSVKSAVLTGAALGPVFSSCNPTYLYIASTVIPSSFVKGAVQLLAYSIGLAAVLLLVSISGRRFLDKIKWLSNPHGFAQRAIAIVFIIVGISIASGFDKDLQTYLVEKDFLNLQSIEERLTPKEAN